MQFAVNTYGNEKNNKKEFKNYRNFCSNLFMDNFELSIYWVIHNLLNWLLHHIGDVRVNIDCTNDLKEQVWNPIS